MPDAPVLGTVNVTVTPVIGLPSVSSTIACSVAPKFVLTTVVCVDPACTADGAGVAAVLVSVKLVVVLPPAARGVLAVTVIAPSLCRSRQRR